MVIPILERYYELYPEKDFSKAYNQKAGNNTYLC